MKIEIHSYFPISSIFFSPNTRDLYFWTYFFFSGEVVIEFQEFNVDGVKHGQNANCLESDRFVVEQQIRGLGWRQIRRYCGNWNEKLKAIHVVTKTSSIRIGSMLYPMHKNEKSRRGFVAKVGVVCASPHEYKQQRPNKRFLTRELHRVVLNILTLPLLSI